MNEDNTDVLLLRLDAECTLSSAERATQIFCEYRGAFQSSTDLDVKRNAARVLHAMWNKVDAIVSMVERVYASAIMFSQTRAKEELDSLKFWRGANASLLNSANEFLDRFEAVEASRKKIEAVCDRLGTVKAFFDCRKDEQLLKGDWELNEIHGQLERAVAASLELTRAISKEQEK